MKRRTTRRQSAFTLIEFMVAAAISTLVTLVVFSIYRTATTTFESVETDRRVFDKAVSAVETLCRDLTCSALVPIGGTVCFLLDQGAQASDPNSDLSFHTATRVESDDGVEQFQIERVRFCLQSLQRGDGSMQALIRTKQVMAADGTLGDPTQDDIARDVEVFRVSFFDGENWYDTWPASQAKRSTPSAARVTLSCRHGQTVKTFESTAVIRVGLPL